MAKRLAAIVVAIATISVSCGGESDPEWEAEYRERLEADWATLEPMELVGVCSQIDLMTDAELRGLMTEDEAMGREGTNTFVEVMSYLNQPITVEASNRALDIAIEIGRDHCRGSESMATVPDARAAVWASPIEVSEPITTLGNPGPDSTRSQRRNREAITPATAPVATISSP